MEIQDRTDSGLVELGTLPPGTPFRVDSTGKTYVVVRVDRHQGEQVPVVSPTDGWMFSEGFFSGKIEVRRLRGTLILENG